MRLDGWLIVPQTFEAGQKRKLQLARRQMSQRTAAGTCRGNSKWRRSRGYYVAIMLATPFGLFGVDVSMGRSRVRDRKLGKTNPGCSTPVAARHDVVRRPPQVCFLTTPPPNKKIPKQIVIQYRPLATNGKTNFAPCLLSTNKYQL